MAREQIVFYPRMTEFLVERLEEFSTKPLLILDVGAREGVEFRWDFYGDRVFKIGFEPDVVECDRLNQSVRDRNCKFYPVALGKKREKRRFSVCQQLKFSSFYPANMQFLRRFSESDFTAMTVIETLELETIDLDSFTKKNKIDDIDFIKLDVEGSELDILQGARQVLQKSVLGLSLKVLFHSCIRNQPSFSEIDLFLNSLGFRLFDLVTYRHARKALPFPNDALEKNQQGQILCGQALYFRDGVSELEMYQKKFQWDRSRILKLSSLMEIFCLTDCAVELIQTAIKRQLLNRNLEFLIDYLTPSVKTDNTVIPISYEDYLQMHQSKSKTR